MMAARIDVALRAIGARRVMMRSIGLSLRTSARVILKIDLDSRADHLEGKENKNEDADGL
jgi:hypothetical protein